MNERKNTGILAWILKGFQRFDTVASELESQENHLQPQRKIHLVTKRGYVKNRRREYVTVDIDDQILTFSLENLTVPFSPRKYDRITLLCEIDQDSSLISDCESTLEVRNIEAPTVKKITGKVTTSVPNEYGIIDGRYIFFWDAVANGYTVIGVGDPVTADCIECESVDESIFRWRCLLVTPINENQNVDNIGERLLMDKDTVNKHGIVVTEELKVEFNNVNETKKLEMNVTNTSDDDVKVVESYFRCNKEHTQLELVSPTRKASFLLKSGEVKVYEFVAKSKNFGDAREEFVIKFIGKSAGSFQITRFINVLVHDTERKHPTIGTGSNVQINYGYTRSVLTRYHPTVISGARPIQVPNFMTIKFENWHIEPMIRDIILVNGRSRSHIFDALATACPHLKDNLTIKNYSQVFHDLLHLEECEMEHSFRKYDRRSFFTREKGYLALTVSNVAESRPSIVIGDYIMATYAWAKEGDKKVTRKAWIHEVQQNRILLSFDESFYNNYENEDYQITFHFSRKSLQKQHHAIELATNRIPSILFPDKIQQIEKQVDVELNMQNGQLQSGNAIIPWFNPSLNIVQKQAVSNILQGVARPMPYVIFGPPGTGKTVTLIETILQLYKSVPHSRILVATPSNSSANLITERIVESGVLMQGEFMRLVSHNIVTRGSIPDKIIRHCGTIHTENTLRDSFELSESGIKKKCTVTHLKKHRLLIGTCITLGTLMQCDFPEDHFSHVIIDESGQSLETELIIPMSFVDKDIGQIVLAGDPMQLGPIVISHFAKTLGLDQSYLVRLLDRSPYKPDLERFEHRYDPRLVTRLVYNYRSVPSIMSIYSELFYDKDLKAMVNDVDSADAKILRRLAPIILPKNVGRKVTDGVIFVGVKGKNEKSTDSPSWYNKQEAESVVQYFNKLIRMGHSADDIGIITPYTQQVKTIRRKFTKDIPKVGTVEEFQGQERKIILLSTVRTKATQLRIDQRYSLGFIKSPKRMNVAISRARALLMIFGSPKLLKLDANWKFLIEHCIKNKCCDSDSVNMMGNDDDSDDDDE